MSRNFNHNKQRKQHKGKRAWETASTVHNIIPDQMDVWLAYPAGGVILTASSPNSAKRWQPNAPYDVDPALGSTSTPGFSEWAAFYSYVRCIEYAIEADIVNLDSLAANVYFTHTNTDPGTSGTNNQLYAMGAYGHQIILSPKGGMDRFKYAKHMTVQSLVGAIDVRTDDSFRSLTNTTPADLIFFGLGIGSTNGSNFTTGLGYALTVRMRCEFYGRKNLLTSFLNDQKLVHEAEKEKWKGTVYLQQCLENYKN